MFYMVVLGILAFAEAARVEPPEGQQGVFYGGSGYDDGADCVCADGVDWWVGGSGNRVPCYVNVYAGNMGLNNFGNFLSDFSHRFSKAYKLTIPAGVTLNENSFQGTNCRNG